ncbi:transposase [Sediminicoccus sp. KRV36]|uniref:transposase n=1 Tax=Sediminicoccus sp. KRV36 TaxID=3133721 RepID=UPI00200E1E92|nr:transposase [Sediminicoccus rosea]UPY37865.1 transposase [Sediminicoccus rosea]
MKQRIPFTALSDRQWDALRPYAEKDHPAGRPMADLRQRMNAILFLMSTDAPWRELPPEYGPAGTVARHYRRLTHAGLWENLLIALHDLGPRHPLQQLRRLIFRAVRRAASLRGLRIIVLARRLKLLEALPGPAWMVADPDLSQSLVAWQMREYQKPGRKNFGRFVQEWGRTLRNLLTLAGGRPSMARSVRLALA